MSAKFKQTLVKFFKNLFNPKNLGIYLLTSVLVWSFAYYYSRVITTRQTISVMGVAFKDVAADTAAWEVVISSSALDRKQSLEQLYQDEKELKNFFTLSGFTDKEIQKGSYNTNPVYKMIEHYQTSEITGYNSTVYYKITSLDVYKLNDAHKSLNQYVVDKNITLSQDNVSFIYTQLEDLKIPLLEQAIDNAKDRAKAIAKRSGSKIGKISYASQGVFQLNSKGDYTVSDYGNFNISSIKKTAKATVSVSFEVK
jgi:uncharacterized protein